VHLGYLLDLLGQKQDFQAQIFYCQVFHFLLSKIYFQTLVVYFLLKVHLPFQNSVEIFGSQLMGLEIKDIEPKKQEPTVIFQENSEREDELLVENKQLKSENKFLKEENERLDSRIFELENLVSALQDQVSNLNALVVEQVNVIYKWVLGI